MKEPIQKQILKYLNERFEIYKILVEENNDVLGIPKEYYQDGWILLEISETFPLPTNIEFHYKHFTIIASFNNTIYNVSIPYNRIKSIVDKNSDDGIYFNQPLFSYKKQKPTLKIIN